jgi:hypothetical protein
MSIIPTLSVRSTVLTVALIATAAAAQSAQAQSIVFQSDPDNGIFTPFNPSNALTVRYGDSGWLGNNLPPQRLQSITLRMYAGNAVNPGTGTMRFSFHDGDPSGLVFGSGQQLLSTTIPDIAIPAGSEGGFFTSFEVNIPLNGIVTTGGFNNVGWSVGWTAFNYVGDVGFACASANAQPVGFFTNNASFNNGTSWSLFAFGPDPVTQVANYSVTITRVDPCNAADVAGANQSLPADGLLTADDIIVFLGWYFASDTRADVAGPNQTPGPDTAFTADDIIVFLGNYFQGC